MAPSSGYDLGTRPRMYKLRHDSNSDADRRHALNYSYGSSARYRASYGYSYRRATIAGQPRISIFDPRT